MLMDKMRQGAQSLTAKIIFVIIMVSFALAGIGGYAVRKPNTDPVEVDGIAIHAMDFDRAYREQKQEIQRQAGEHFAEMTETIDLTTEIINDSVVEHKSNCNRRIGFITNNNDDSKPDVQTAAKAIQ